MTIVDARATALLREVEDDVERMRRDAERYRWLRAGNAYFPEEAGLSGEPSRGGSRSETKSAELAREFCAELLGASTARNWEV